MEAAHGEDQLLQHWTLLFDEQLEQSSDSLEAKYQVSDSKIKLLLLETSKKVKKRLIQNE